MTRDGRPSAATIPLLAFLVTTYTHSKLCSEGKASPRMSRFRNLCSCASDRTQDGSIPADAPAAAASGAAAGAARSAGPAAADGSRSAAGAAAAPPLTATAAIVAGSG